MLQLVLNYNWVAFINSRFTNFNKLSLTLHNAWHILLGIFD